MAGEGLQRLQEVLTRVICNRVSQKCEDEDRFTSWLLYPNAWEDKGKLITELVNAVDGLPDSQVHILRILTGVTTQGGGKLEYITNLESSESPAIRAAASAVIRKYEVRRAARKRRAEQMLSLPERMDPRLVRFEPVSFTFGSAGNGQPFRGRILPAGDGCDLAYSGHQAYLMKSPGRLNLILDLPAIDSIYPRIVNAVFDGRFAWLATVHPSQRCGLQVIDPSSNQTWDLSETQGLPNPPQSQVPRDVNRELAIAALSPGRILVVSYFGRTAIAEVTFDRNENAKVEIIHEAREVSRPDDPEAWRGTVSAFTPGVTGVLHRPEHPEDARVLVERNNANSGVREHPLLLSVASREIRAVQSDKFKDLYNTRFFAWDNGTLYKLNYSYPPSRFDLIAINSADLQPRVLAGPAPEGIVVTHGGTVHIAGTYWWSLPPGADKFRVLTTKPPWFYGNSTVAGSNFVGLKGSGANKMQKIQSSPSPVGIDKSNHYGLLLHREIPQPGKAAAHELLQVVFEDEPKE